MTLERRPECENRTSEGGPILLTGDHNHFRQCEQMDIGLMGSRAWWLRTEATTVPKPPTLYSIPVHDDKSELSKSMQAC